jgi:hypothetical protein
MRQKEKISWIIDSPRKICLMEQSRSDQVLIASHGTNDRFQGEVWESDSDRKIRGMREWRSHDTAETDREYKNWETARYQKAQNHGNSAQNARNSAVRNAERIIPSQQDPNQVSRWINKKSRCTEKKLTRIKNDGNKNIMERKKYTVKSAEDPLFPKFSNINIFEWSQQRFGMIQPNNIISECEFNGRLYQC